MFASGISKEGDILDLALALGLTKKSGAFFTYGDTKMGQGRENAKEFLKQHPEIARELEEKIRASGARAVALPRPGKEDSGSE
jgi:recombination protein RecA